MAILLYSTWGYFAVYSGMQYAVKKEVKRKLKQGVPKNELHLLKITRQQEATADVNVFQRIHKGEFRYYGEMYDIVYQENRGDTTYYHCIHDKEEEILFAGLSKAINMYIAENPIQQKKQKNMLQQLIKEYTFPAKPKIPYITCIENTYALENCTKYFGNVPDIASPPPQFI